MNRITGMRLHFNFGVQWKPLMHFYTVLVIVSSHPLHCFPVCFLFPHPSASCQLWLVRCNVPPSWEQSLPVFSAGSVAVWGEKRFRLSHTWSASVGGPGCSFWYDQSTLFLKEVLKEVHKSLMLCARAGWIHDMFLRQAGHIWFD